MFVRSAHANFAWQARARGDVQRARRHALLGQELSPVSASSGNDVALVLALVECDAGRFALARDWHAAVRPSPLLISRVLHALGGVHLGLALADDALLRTHLDLALLEETVASDDPNGIVVLACSFAAALYQLERRREGDALLERFAGTIVTTYGFTPSLLTVAALRPDLARPLGGLLATRGALDELFHRAARALFEAELAAASGDAARASAEGAAAARGFDEIGWAVLAARAAEAGGDLRAAATRYRAMGHVGGLQRIGRRALGADATPAARRVLTARQHELARLIASGCGNRAAAEALSVSEKTVERHLTLIYAKLGVSSRAQLAAYVAGAEAAQR
jgi:DNA-binding CsgD family transcriptional regulator